MKSIELFSIVRSTPSVIIVNTVVFISEYLEYFSETCMTTDVDIIFDKQILCLFVAYMIINTFFLQFNQIWIVIIFLCR